MMSGKGATLAATLAGVGVVFAAPFILLRYTAAGAVTTATPEPLANQAVRRGAYINSGSRDAGVDPDWIDGAYQPRRARQAQRRQASAAAAAAASPVSGAAGGGRGGGRRGRAAPSQT